MQLDEAVEHAIEILDEEQKRPTVDYVDTGLGAPTTQRPAGAPREFERLNLNAQRGEDLREVHANPKRYRFVSSNYVLLTKIFGQLEPGKRADFVECLATRVPDGESGEVKELRFPVFARHMSYLPLVLEFCVRTGYTDVVMAGLGRTERPTPGIVVMLYQLEEMISLNFNLFSNQQLSSIPLTLRSLAEHIKSGMSPLPTGMDMESAVRVVRQWGPALATAGHVVLRRIEVIGAECKQARFHYLSGALQELPNLEVEADRARVEDFLLRLGFNPAMTTALNQAESEYASVSLFNLKSCLGHLRSVLEHLHLEACRSIATTQMQTVPDKWGTATAYLRVNGYLSEKEEKLVGGLHAVLSDQGVHPLFAEREYARLLRNMTIEYGLLLLTVLEKKGVHIQ